MPTSQIKKDAKNSLASHPLSTRWHIANHRTPPSNDEHKPLGDGTSPSKSEPNPSNEPTRDPAIGLTTADMDFPRSKGMEDVIHRYAKEGCLIYNTQHPDLAPTVLERLRTRYNIQTLDEKDIVFFPSVVTAMNALLQALTPPGTPYTLLTPNYPPLRSLLQTDQKIVEVPLLHPAHPDPAERGLIDFDALKTSFAQTGSKVLVISNPQNPLGRVPRKEELLTLKNLCQKEGVHILSDEIWMDWDLSHPSTSMATLIPPRNDLTKDTVDATPTDAALTKDAPLITSVMATSKTFNLGALNCAYILTSDAALKQKLHHYCTYYCPPASLLGQEMLIHLYQEGDPVFANYKEIVLKNRETLTAFCRKNLPVITPLLGEGTHIAWLNAEKLVPLIAGLPEISSPQDKTPSPAKFFRTYADVDMFPGELFGTGFSACMRMNLATTEEIFELALKRMAKAVAKLSD